MAFMELSARLGLDGSAFRAGIDKAKSSVASLRSSLGAGAKAAAKSGIAQVLGVAAVVQYARSTLEMGGQISDTSARLGISAEELQRWTYAAGLAGAGTAEVTSFFEKLTLAKAKAMKGDKAAIASFKALGVSMDDVANKKVEDIAAMVGATMSTGDISTLLAPLVAVGGKAAGKLIPTFKGDFEATKAAAPVMSNEAVAQLDEAGDAVDKVMLQLRGPMAEALANLIPLIQTVIDGFNGFVALFKDIVMPMVSAWGTMFDKLSRGELPSIKEVWNLGPTGVAAGFVTGENKMSNFQKYGKDIRDREIAAADAEFFAKKSKGPKAEMMKESGDADNKLKKAAAFAPMLAIQPALRDSLASIGGFTLAQNREVLDVQKDQLSVLEKIAENTADIEAPEEFDDGL